MADAPKLDSRFLKKILIAFEYLTSAQNSQGSIKSGTPNTITSTSSAESVFDILLIMQWFKINAGTFSQIFLDIT